LVTSTDSPLNTRLAGKSRPRAAPFASMPSKSPSLAIALPVGSRTTISSDWLATTQMLSLASTATPSAPLMLYASTDAAPAAPPDTGIFTTESLPVLAT